MNASNDGSESVDQFLARIASVKDGRDEASEERKRRMEDEFLKNRSERQARRLERARSISPSKTGPARPTSIATPTPQHRDATIDPPVGFTPRSATLSRSNAVRTSPTLDPKQIDTAPASPTSLNVRSSPASATTLSRSGTLSWQQRPAGRDATVARPRPLSTIATTRSVSQDHQSKPSPPAEQSREDIAASLSQKDASWFRQTQDQGISSAAYRKNQVEDTPVLDPFVRSMQLPGMSKEPSSDNRSYVPKQRSPDSDGHSTVPVSQPKVSVPRPKAASPTVSVTASPKIIEQPATKLDSSEVQEGRNDHMSSRSPSPTKGLGGFVQSAMMRRSDSVNKRWSVQATAGLKRGDSVAGARPLSSLNPVQKSTPPPILPPKPITSQSKVGSATVRDGAGSQESVPQGSNDPLPSGRATPLERPVTPPQGNELHRSPSRAQESRRWSPTKSSWLESTLLSKPEPAKSAVRKDEQPQWMVNLQRSKSTRDLSPEKGSPTIKAPVQGNATVKSELISSHKTNVTGSSKPMPRNVALPTSAARTKDGNIASKADTPSSSPEAIPAQTAQIETETPSTIPAKVDSDDVGKQPVLSKPKPETPPKPDLRATLRSRTVTTDSKKGTEPEFRAMFGKLKPAQTKNYVAPDTLKNNIVSGKAALNTTAGPQKTKHVDEFKESILQKKETMKAIALERNQSTSPTKELDSTEPPLPEALQRRKTLHKATPSITKIQSESDVRGGGVHNRVKSTESSKGKSDISIARPAFHSSGQDQPRTSKISTAPPASAQPPTQPVGLGGEQRSNQADTESKPRELDPAPPSKPPSKPTFLKEAPKLNLANKPVLRSSETKAPSQVSPISTQSRSPPPLHGALPPGSKLASRLNPNLAALLSKGSTPRANPNADANDSSDDLPNQREAAGRALSDEKEIPGGELTHMTKGRAKGPKRRAPKAQNTPNAKPSEPPVQIQSISSPKSKVPEPVGEAVLQSSPSPTRSTVETKGEFNTSASVVPKSVATAILDAFSMPSSPTIRKSEFRATKPEAKSSPGTPNVVKAKPAVATKSPELRRVSSSQNTQTTEQLVSKPSTPSRFTIAADNTTTKLPNDATLSASPRMVQSPINVESPSTRPLVPSKSRVNTPKQPAPDKPTSSKPVIQSPVMGLGLQNKIGLERSDPTTVSVPPRASRVAPKQSPATIGTSKPLGDVQNLINEYFGSEKPSSRDRAEFDTQALLQHAYNIGNNEADKIKTASNMIWEVGTDGKKTALPPQQEHILYEDCMYLMIHTYEATASEAKESSKTTEVYLWTGDRVPSAATDDVRLFCKQAARDHGAKLDIIKQGKEPSRFFLALGGIMITRRSKASALYVLCGRKHLGHIAFDEVDFALDSLCSGFPYLISAKFGSLFLWKGKGSAVDEVGCARLIGMDLGLTGDIEEVDEGEEPPSFWEAFSSPGDRTQTNRRQGSVFWQQRSAHDSASYPCYMYRIKLERPKSAGGFWGLRSASPPKSTSKASIELVSPYSQADLMDGSVHVLDLYRDVYVLFDTKNTTKPADCATALYLAQEIAMLSPAIQGRAVVPSCHVVFGELPTDVKSCFRKYITNPASPKNGSEPAACVKLEDVMQALAI